MARDPNKDVRAWIEKLNSIGNVAKDSVPELAKEVEKIIIRNASAQRGPDGKRWPASLDGQRVLSNVKQNLRVRVVRETVVVSLKGRYARHHLGVVRGKISRPIIPSGRIPTPMVEAIKEVVERAFKE